MEGNKCNDAIIWIGQSYPEILCSIKPEPKTYDDYCNKMDNCYVHEAEMRGCCRRVPKTPKRLIPDKSRIFLIHRDGKPDDQGSIFGYYIMRRFEKIGSESIDNMIQGREINLWLEEFCQKNVKVISDKVKEEGIDNILNQYNVLMENNIKEKIPEYWKKGVEQRLAKGYCFTSKPKPPESSSWPAPDNSIEDMLTDILEDILKELIEDWIGEQIKKLNNPSSERHEELKKAIKNNFTNKSEFGYIPLENSFLEFERHCSKHFRIGATYVVDALTAAITDEFNQKIEKKRPMKIGAGKKLFLKTVEEIRKKYENGTLIKLTEMDKSLKGHAKFRGELIVFDTPYPVFEHKERADFRGIRYVDGNKMLNEIANYYDATKQGNTYVIPYQRVKC